MSVYSLYQFVVVPFRDNASNVMSRERVPNGICERGKFRQPVHLQ